MKPSKTPSIASGCSLRGPAHGLQQQAITLAFYGGHTYNQVASILDAPLGTVKTRIRDALIKLRDCMLRASEVPHARRLCNRLVEMPHWFS